MKKIEYVYFPKRDSTYSCECFEEAAQDYMESLCKKDYDGTTNITIYRAEKEDPNVEKYIHFSDYLIDNLDWDFGDLSYDWVNSLDTKSLDDYMRKCFISWIEENNKKPTFYTVENVTAMEVEVIHKDEYTCDFELIGETK